MKRPLNPNGVMPAYGKMPKLEVPPFSGVSDPLLLLRSGYTSKMLSAPAVTVKRLNPSYLAHTLGNLDLAYPLYLFQIHK